MEVENTEEKEVEMKEEVFADRVTRIVKENHQSAINSVKICPFSECNNLICTAGGNQVSIYDCVHRGNFCDLVSNFFNYPKNHKQLKRKKDGKIKVTKEQIKSLTFNDISWMKRKNENDVYIVAGCNDGNIYIFSLMWSKVEILFPGMFAFFVFLVVFLVVYGVFF